MNSDWYDPAPNARLIQIIVLNCFVLFIFLIRDLSGLSIFSLIGFFSVVYTIIVSFQYPQYLIPKIAYSYPSSRLP